MPTPKRRPDPSVIARLRETPQRFEFFQAVRVLRRYFKHKHPAGGEPLHGQIRFRNSLNIGFAPSEIEALTLQQRGDEAEAPAWPAQAPAANPHGDILQAELTPAFFGLTGTHGTLPRAYSDQLIAREITHRDRAARAFLDMFTSRAAAQFYLAWEKHRLYLRYEHEREERFLPMLLALLGRGSEADLAETCDPQQALLAETLAYYAGALRQSAKPAHLIERIVADHFGVPIRLKQFAGRWHLLEAGDCSVLGMVNATLGEDALCGERVWQCEDSFEIEVGPLSGKDFKRFLPGGDATAALCALLRSLVGISWSCTLRPVLRRADIQAIRLGGDGGGPRIGYDTWISSAAAEQDGRDVVFELPLCPAEPTPY